MKPLVVLLVTFVLSLIIIKLAHGGWNFSLAGTIAMSAMLFFTASDILFFQKE